MERARQTSAVRSTDSDEGFIERFPAMNRWAIFGCPLHGQDLSLDLLIPLLITHYSSLVTCHSSLVSELGAQILERPKLQLLDRAFAAIQLGSDLADRFLFRKPHRHHTPLIVRQRIDQPE